MVSLGRHVVVQCGACPHRNVLKPTALGVQLATVVTLAGANLVCSACGSKKVLTYPESNRDARKGARAVTLAAFRPDALRIVREGEYKEFGWVITTLRLAPQRAPRPRPALAGTFRPWAG